MDFNVNKLLSDMNVKVIIAFFVMIMENVYSVNFNISWWTKVVI